MSNAPNLLGPLPANPGAGRTPNAPDIGSGRVKKLSPKDVRDLLDAIKDPRSRELEAYQAYYEGNAYEGRKQFWDDSVPMQERKPCIVYPIVKLAAESNVAFAMGEGRFPQILSMSSESDDVFDQQLGLDDGESKLMDSFNSKLLDLGRLQQVFRQAYRMAQASRSVALILGFRAGMPFVDLVWAKLCTPSFEDQDDPSRCTKLVIRYRYTEPWRDPLVTGGEWWTRVFEYLRVVDDVADTVYKPVAVWEKTDPGATLNSPVLKRTTHGFKLCPVHWYARAKESVVGQSPDGKAVHEAMCGLVEQLDLALSQRHRAAIYSGDPQTVLIGVQDDEQVGTMGREGRQMLLPGDLNADGTPGQWAKAFAGANMGTPGAIKRGAGQVWRLKDPTGKALVLALSGDALKVLDDNAKDIASRLCDGMGVTVMDPSDVSGSGDLSGRTLSFIFSKQINRVSQDREDLGKCCILPVMNLFYRLLLSKPDGVYLPGLKKVLPVLKRFYVTTTGPKPQQIWFAPQLKLSWGDYFEPSDTDEGTRTQNAINALNAKIITKKTAVEHIKPVFQILSVDEYVDSLDQEEQDNQAKQLDMQAKQSAVAGSVAPSGPAGNGGKPGAVAPAKGGVGAPKPAPDGAAAPKVGSAPPKRK